MRRRILIGGMDRCSSCGDGNHFTKRIAVGEAPVHHFSLLYMRSDPTFRPIWPLVECTLHLNRLHRFTSLLTGLLFTEFSARLSASPLKVEESKNILHVLWLEHKHSASDFLKKYAPSGSLVV